MEATISSVTTPGADTPTKMSAPFSASASVPFRSSGFVTWAISSFTGVRLSAEREMMPLLSHNII